MTLADLVPARASRRSRWRPPPRPRPTSTDPSGAMTDRDRQADRPDRAAPRHPRPARRADRPSRPGDPPGDRPDASARARSTRSWAPTARARRRSPTRSWATRPTRSPAARSSGRAATSSRSRPTSARGWACSSRSSTRPRSPACRVASFIRSALNARLQGVDKIDGIDPTDPAKGGISMRDFRNLMRETFELLKMDEAFAQRYVNDGFSGGEKKRLEMLQMAVLEARDGDPRRDRQRPRHRRAADRRRGRQRDAQPEPRRAADHPLPAPAQLHHAGRRPRAGRRPDRDVGRQGARAAARGRGLRADPPRGRPRDDRPRRSARRAAGARGRPAGTTREPARIAG